MKRREENCSCSYKLSLLEDRKNSPFEERKKFCPFSQQNSPRIDYKDTKLLSRYISEHHISKLTKD